jgi:hypothetical protein
LHEIEPLTNNAIPPNDGRLRSRHLFGAAVLIEK